MCVLRCVCHVYTYMCAITIHKKGAVILKERKEGYMGWFGGKRRKEETM